MLLFSSLSVLHCKITLHTPLVCRYSEGEIRFNLMAIVSDRKMIYERKIAELQTQLTEVSGSKRRRFSPFFSFFLPDKLHTWRPPCVGLHSGIVSLILKCQEQLISESIR